MPARSAIMFDDIEKLGRLFYTLCMIFGGASILVGLVSLFYSYELNAQLGQSLVEVNTALYASTSILANITSLTTTAASSTQVISQNVSVMLDNFSNSINTIQRDLRQVADNFSNGAPSIYIPQSTQQLADTFESLATEFNSINRNSIPPLRRLVNSTLSHTATPLSNIAQQTSRLNDTLSSLSNRFRTDASFAQLTIPIFFLGFGLYSILQGAIFVLLGRLSVHLVNDALMPKGKAGKKPDAGPKAEKKSAKWTT